MSEKSIEFSLEDIDYINRVSPETKEYLLREVNIIKKQESLQDYIRAFSENLNIENFEFHRENDDKFSYIAYKYKNKDIRITFNYDTILLRVNKTRAIKLGYPSPEVFIEQIKAIYKCIDLGIIFTDFL